MDPGPLPEAPEARMRPPTGSFLDRFIRKEIFQLFSELSPDAQRAVLDALSLGWRHADH